MGFLAVSITRNAAVVRRTSERLGLGMSVAVAQSELLAPLGMQYVPATLFVDASGKIVASAVGARSPAFLRERAQALLK